MPYLGEKKERQDYRTYQIPRGYLYTHALNECLHNHPEANTRAIMHWCQVKFSFEVDRFWFCLSGLKKDLYYPVYGLTPGVYLEIFDRYRCRVEEAIRDSGYVGNVFMIMEEDLKQMAVLFSATRAARCSPRELAEQINALGQEIYLAEVFKGDGRYCNVTALSEELHGFAAIRKGYLQTRHINDLSFFRMEPEVLTQEEVDRTCNAADYPQVMEACVQLALAVDEGDGAWVRQALDALFLSLLKGSYSLQLCRDALSFCKNLLQVRCTVYGVTQGLELERLCDVERYFTIEECVDALSPVFRVLCEAVRSKGPCARPVLQAMYFIKKHYGEDILLNHVARYANVNANYLSGMFRENTGIPLRDYITQVRVDEAKKRLETGARVGETALAVGFCDAKYFGQVFKRIVGVSPAQYREEHT